MLAKAEVPLHARFVIVMRLSGASVLTFEKIAVTVEQTISEIGVALLTVPQQPLQI